MVKNQAVTKATLEAKEWERELDDADLAAVSGGGIGEDYEKLGGIFSELGKSLGEKFAEWAKSSF